MWLQHMPGGITLFASVHTFFCLTFHMVRCFDRKWWVAGMVICLERGADLHMAQVMPLPLTVCCFSKIEIGFTFLVPAHLGSPGQ